MRGCKHNEPKKLNRVNEISKEISEIEEFLDRMTFSRGRINILGKISVERGTIIRIPAYGRSDSYDYTVPKELTSEVLRVIRDHREKLIFEQEKLWGSE